MRKLMERLFARYGTEAILHTATESRKVKVFFSSVNSKSWQNMESHHHPLGKIASGQYICRFPVDTAVEAGDWVELKGSGYRICRVEEVAGPGGQHFYWALCTGKGGEDLWG